MRSRIIAAVVALLVFAAPATAQTTGQLSQEDVDAALSRRQAAGSELEDLTAQYQQAIFDEEILRERISELAKSVSDLERDIGEKNVRVADLVMTRYMAGSPLGTERVFAASSFTDLPIQAEYSKLVNETDLALLTSLETSEKLHVEQQQLLDSSLLDQEAVVKDLDEIAQKLVVALADADSEYQAVATAFQKQEEERRAREAAERRRKAEEAARQAAAEAAAAAAAATTTTAGPVTTTSAAPATTVEASPTTTAPAATTTTAADVSTTTSPPAATTTTAAAATTTTAAPPPPPPPADTSGKTCPINAATSFSNSWGAPRSGGRTHKGVDMVAARNAPVVAIESGTVTRTSNSSLGGLSIYLTGNSGSRYYYAHLEYIESGISGGTGVSVGQLLGGNGSSGNAPAWLPHVHFQYAPPGLDWVNPYPLVKPLCG